MHTKQRILSITLALALLMAALPGRVTAEPNDWTTIVPGIEYRTYRVSGPADVYVARMDRSNPNVTIESSIGSGYLSDGVRESVPGMYRRYNGGIGYWGKEWGSRNRVAVAINGFFFGPPYEGSDTPWGGQTDAGWHDKRLTELENESVSGFVWTLDGEAFISECNNHDPDKQRIYYLDETDTVIDNQKFQGVNTARGNDQIILYTPQYNTNTGTDDSGDEVLVEMDRPTSILPYPAMAKGTIRLVRSQGSTMIPYGYIVLSAKGLPGDKLISYAANSGQRIGISQAVRWCNATPANGRDWTNAYANIGGDKYFLKGGVVQSFPGGGDPVVDNARTAIAYSSSYIFFIVVDGKHPGVSVGMSLPELATFAKNTLGASDAVSQDSGGSATMVVNGNIVNDTYCNFTDCRSAAVAVPQEEGHTYLPEEVQDCTPGNCEPLVANGMMMVEVQGRVISSLFPAGDTFTPNNPISLRLGPGNNYPSLTTIPAGTPGSVVSNQLNGIWAKGFYWWLVDFGDQTGWAPADNRLIQTNEYFLPLVP